MRNKLQSVTDYQPQFEVPEEDLLKDQESGLPEIHKVNGAQTKNKSTSYMRENTMQSLHITDKIDLAMGAFNFGHNAGEEVNSALSEMMRVATSSIRFDSPKEFKEYLTEGVLFNVTRMVSRAINIPQGEYFVYSISPKKAMLIPTTEMSVQETDFNGPPRGYEIHTSHLLGCWDRAEKLLHERSEQPRQFKSEKNLKKQEKRKRIQDVSKDMHGNMKYPRDKDFRSEREAHDLSLDDIVSRLGDTVDKSTVSRWGAEGGTPSSRMPSGENMIKLSQMGIDPDTFTKKVGRGSSTGTPTKGGGQVSGV